MVKLGEGTFENLCKTELKITSIDILIDAEEDNEDQSGKLDINGSNFILNTYNGKKRFNLELSSYQEDQLLQIS